MVLHIHTHTGFLYFECMSVCVCMCCPVLATCPRIYGGHRAPTLSGVVLVARQWRIFLNCLSPLLYQVSRVFSTGAAVSSGAGASVSQAGNQEARAAYSGGMRQHCRFLSSSMCIHWAWHPRSCGTDKMAGSTLLSFSHAFKQS